MTISPQYRQYLRSDKWNARRRAALHRANYRCELCSRAKPLQVHHLTYERIFEERPEDLRAVCDRCHKRLHKIRPLWIRILRWLFLQ